MTIPWHRMFALSKFIQSALATKWHNCAKVTRFQEIRLRASFYYYLTDPRAASSSWGLVDVITCITRTQKFAHIKCLLPAVANNNLIFDCHARLGRRHGKLNIVRVC